MAANVEATQGMRLDKDRGILGLGDLQKNWSDGVKQISLELSTAQAHSPAKL